MWSVDLALYDEELVAECEDFCVTGVSCGEYPSESVENKANQSGKERHERRRLQASAMAKTRRITGRMNLRPPQPQEGRIWSICRRYFDRSALPRVFDWPVHVTADSKAPAICEDRYAWSGCCEVQPVGSGGVRVKGCNPPSDTSVSTRVALGSSARGWPSFDDVLH